MSDFEKNAMDAGGGVNEGKDFNVSSPTGKPKKRRTAEEISKDLEEKREETLKKVEEYEKNSASYEKQIRELMKKKQEADRKIKSARRDTYTHIGMKTFGDMLRILNLKEMERGCNTLSEFENLRRVIRNRIEDLLEVERMRTTAEPEKLVRFKNLLEFERLYKAEHPELYSKDGDTEV